MSNVYAVAGAKGGVGKTTTSVNLGAAVARAGHSAVTVELDLGMANLVDFLDVDVDVTEATTLHDVFRGDADVEAACYEVDDAFHMAISGTDLAGYADTDLSLLPKVVEKLRWHYDIVLLDTPAGLSEETVRPLQVADGALIVSTPRVASIRNARNTLELADRVDTEACGLVLTKSGTGASPGADRIAEFLGLDLLGHVPEDDAIPHSQDRGVSVIDYAPNSGAAVAYRKIGRKVVENSDTAAESHETLGSESHDRRSTETASRADPESDQGRAGDGAGGTWVSPGRTSADGPASDGPTGTRAGEDRVEEPSTGDDDGTGDGTDGGPAGRTDDAADPPAARDGGVSPDESPQSATGPDAAPETTSSARRSTAESGALTRGGAGRAGGDERSRERASDGAGADPAEGTADDVGTTGDADDAGSDVGSDRGGVDPSADGPDDGSDGGAPDGTEGGGSPGAETPDGKADADPDEGSRDVDSDEASRDVEPDAVGRDDDQVGEQAGNSPEAAADEGGTDSSDGERPAVEVGDRPADGPEDQRSISARIRSVLGFRGP